MPIAPPLICIRDERTVVLRYPQDSRQRQVGELWLLWLEHILNCQNNGVRTDVLPPGSSELAEEREKLAFQAQQLDILMPPHNDHEVLSPMWWRILNHNFSFAATVF